MMWFYIYFWVNAIYMGGGVFEFGVTYPVLFELMVVL